MGRKRRNCPAFGCGSTNLARLANHFDQVHGMDTEGRAKWLKWSKLGICVSQPLSFTNISGGAAPILASVIGVSPKTWRISASADARSTPYGSFATDWAQL